MPVNIVFTAGSISIAVILPEIVSQTKFTFAILVDSSVTSPSLTVIVTGCGPAVISAKDGPSGSFLFTEFALGRPLLNPGDKSRDRAAYLLTLAFLRGDCCLSTSVTMRGLTIVRPV
jgi:hypothetical protein